jgi:tetratricopeptide (TPR) repeat protein
MEKHESEEIIKEAMKKAHENIMENPLVAEILLRQIIKCDPEHAEALSLLGLTLHRLRKYVECIEVLQMAIEVNPINPDNYNNIALSYGCLNQSQSALKYMQKAVSLKPESHVFYSNLAMQYRNIGEFDNAIEALNKSIAIKQEAPVWTNLGGIYGELKDLESAEKCLLKAIEIDPECSGAHVDLAFTYHLAGRHKEGFEEYEWRISHFNQMHFYRDQYDQSKRWRNPEQDISGNRILIYAEQGLGDLVMALRWMKKLKKKGVKEVYIHCDPCLNDLVLNTEGVDKVVNRNMATGEGEPFPEYDLQCCGMSLPYLLQCSEITGKAYINNKPIDVKSSYPDTFNIGICWAGSPAHPNDSVRSMCLSNFREIRIPGVKLFSLQKDVRPRVRKDNKTAIDLTEGAEDLGLVDTSSHMNTFSETASLAAGLDLVITVDTALLHICGACGIPCWGLIPYNPDWRWGLDGEDTNLYDSIRLFRQSKPGDWDGVFKRAAKELKKIV